MTPQLQAALCIIALLALAYRISRTQAGHLRVCRYCGDCVQAAPLLPIPCPSCRRWIWTA